MTTTKFWTPGGVVTTGREELHIPPEYARMLAVFAETSADVDLGLHCSRCGQDLVGQNARNDQSWIMACACRTFIGANPVARGN